MAKRFWITVWLACSLHFAGAETIQLGPPPFSLNDKITLAEVHHGGRVMLKYDVRPLGASGLKVQLFLARGKNLETPIREWVYTTPQGNVKLDLKGVPIAVYRVQGCPIDPQGKALAGNERVVFLTYGSGRAWRAFTQPPSTQDQPLSEVDPKSQSAAPELVMDPPGVVVNLGQSAEVQALLRGVEPGAELEWKLEGGGQLRVLEGRKAVYTADKDAPPGRSAVIRVSCKSHPELRANVMVIISDVKLEEPK